jgi:hypothetical protein
MVLFSRGEVVEWVDAMVDNGETYQIGINGNEKPSVCYDQNPVMPGSNPCPRPRLHKILARVVGGVVKVGARERVMSLPFRAF